MERIPLKPTNEKERSDIMIVDLTGKTAVITGAGRGLGKMIAEKLAEAGAEVWLADIDETSAGDSAKQLCSQGWNAHGYGVNVADDSAMEAMFGFVETACGRVDIVVNSAGIMSMKLLDEAEDEEIRRVLDINVLGTVHGMKYGIEKMKKHNFGKIVNISSTAGRRGRPFQPFYSMSKAAIISLTQSASISAAEYNINVNAVCPGIIRTAMWEDILDVMSERTGIDREEWWTNNIENKIALKRPQKDVDIAYAVVFFCSEQASSITGQALNVCGGTEFN